MQTVSITKLTSREFSFNKLLSARDPTLLKVVVPGDSNICDSLILVVAKRTAKILRKENFLTGKLQRALTHEG